MASSQFENDGTFSEEHGELLQYFREKIAEKDKEIAIREEFLFQQGRLMTNEIHKLNEYIETNDKQIAKNDDLIKELRF